jgi:hypothetical protein
MGDVKPWQIGVIAVALLAVCGSIFYSCSGASSTVKQANTARMVDIRTGELFEASYPEKRPVSFPAKNPKSGDASLYPVFFRDNKWSLNTRYMTDIKKDQSLKAGLIVDAKSGEIKVDGKPTQADIFGK